MTQQEIQAGNKLIAEFMGFTESVIRENSMKVPKEEELKYQAIHLSPKQIKYHSSWDWLMPVVEKIGKMYDEKEIDSQENILLLSIFADIKTVWHCVTDFITWHNQK